MRNYKNYLNGGLLLAVSLFVFSGCHQPILDSGETKFKKSSEYHLSDFNFAKQVRYLEVIEYVLHPSYWLM